MSLYNRARANLALLEEAYDNCVTVESLDLERLWDEGIRAVICDHDGVLGPNKMIMPDEYGQEFLERLVKTFGGGKVFILSNARRMEVNRRSYYDVTSVDILWLSAERKPSRDGLRQALERTSLPVEKIAVIDDGLLTGILMAVENGARPLYVKRDKLCEKIWPRIIRLCTTGAQLLLFRLARLGG